MCGVVARGESPGCFREEVEISSPPQGVREAGRGCNNVVSVCHTPHTMVTFARLTLQLALLQKENSSDP